MWMPFSRFHRGSSYNARFLRHRNGGEPVIFRRACQYWVLSISSCLFVSQMLQVVNYD
jgi:hypothetical protein